MKLSVVEGYLYEDGFTTRYNDYADRAELPEDAVGTDEEKQAYEYGDDLVFRTADGKIFLNFDVAKKHAESLDIPELNEVLELLEKAKVLCEVNKGKVPVLATIQDAIGKLEDDGGSELMDKYYDSTCW